MSVFIAFLVLLSLPVVRAVMVYILPVIYYCFGKKFILTSKELKVCWYSGIVRGVIAFALCLQIDSQHKKFIITVALVIVMVTTLLGSSLMQSFVKWIGLEATVQEEKEPP
jgi:NhaP-type Na+/H+ or K+/H+ antiporter